MVVLIFVFVSVRPFLFTPVVITFDVVADVAVVAVDAISLLLFFFVCHRCCCQVFSMSTLTAISTTKIDTHRIQIPYKLFFLL